VDAQTQAFLNRAAQVYGAPRFTLLYRRWLKHGDTVFEPPASPVIAEALATGTARVECLVLPHTYRHLSPLVNRVRPASERVEQDAGQQDLCCATDSSSDPSARRSPHPSWWYTNHAMSVDRLRPRRHISEGSDETRVPEWRGEDIQNRNSGHLR
jgi:hypothetical protein